jgi:RNA polymerase sigma factor (sigma-70 family)
MRGEIIFDQNDSIWEEVITLAAVAAGQTINKFHGFVDLQDMKQIASEWAVRRQDKIREYLCEQDSEGDWVRRLNADYRRQGQTACITWMRRHCFTAARAEKARTLGYEIGDEFFYQPVLIEGLIKVWGTGDYDLAGQVFDATDMGGKRAAKAPNEGNNLVAMVSDIGAAMDSLDLRDYTVLTLRFVDGQTLKHIADFLEVSPQRVEQISQRAVRQIINTLGGRE